MSEKPYNIKRLSQELGVTSRHLLDRCRAEGLSIQNSITKLRPDQTRRVRTWFAENELGNPPETGDANGSSSS